jgi:microcystin-dependent protein
MADVTINNLPAITPSRGLTVPASDGTTTGKLTITQIADQIVPIGSILLWSGSIASIPTNWALCNGSNGTPDLRNRFIVGANVDNAGVANTNITGLNTQTGGTKDAIVVNHTHAITDPGHSHTLPIASGSGGTSKVNTNGGFSTSNIETSVNTTGISINFTGEAGSNQNLPPYYALAYIMRIS